MKRGCACPRPQVYICSSCESRSYCSEKCADKDWRDYEHWKTCMPSFYSLVNMREASPDVPLDVEPQHVLEMEARHRRKAEKRQREREQRLFDLEWERQTRGGERYRFAEDDGEFVTQDRFLPSPTPPSPPPPPRSGGGGGEEEDAEVEHDRRIFWSSSYEEEEEERIPNPIRPESPFYSSSSSPRPPSDGFEEELKRQKMFDDDEDNFPKTQRASWAED